jgi:hypothetical protein
MLYKELSFRVELLQDPSIKWLFERRVNKLIEEIKEAHTIEEEWENIQKILRQAANETFGMKKKWCRKKGLRKWDENLDQIINDKREASKKHLSTGTLEDQTEYTQCTAIAKKTVCKNKRETWNDFVSKLENYITKPRPKTYKIIRALNNDIVEHVKLNPIKLDSWLDYFQDLWSE